MKKPDYLVDHMGFDCLAVGFHSECVVPELELEVHKERALEPSTSFLDVAVIHSLVPSRIPCNPMVRKSHLLQ